MPNGFLEGRKVCLAGRFVSLTHSDLAALIESQGGTHLSRPRRTSFLLVMGDDGWPAQADGSPLRVVRYAAQLEQYGYHVETLSEASFFEKLGLRPSDGTHAQCTMRDLTRMLNVSSARLRRWLRDGLIEPTAVEHRLAYFDFHQVTNARRLSELVSRGASLVSIRSGLEQLQRWLPKEQLPLAQLARLEHDGRLLLRLNDRLLDRQGQRHFDFDAGQRARGAVALSVARQRHCGLDELFDAALAAEDSGRLDEAEQLYAQAIEVDSADPVLHFNRGNVLFALARYDDACASFRASLAYDGDYAEAWNNLGNALMELDDLPAAEAALRRALALLPDDDAVHGSLADVLERRGQAKEAQRHRRLAQQHRQRSPAEHGRQLLRIARPAE